MDSNEAEAAPFDAGDPQAVRKARKSAKRTAIEAEAVIRSMLATEDQRRWWWDLIESCGVYRAEQLDPHALLFATGQRNIGLRLLAAIPPDILRRMSDEANLKDKQDVP